MSDAIPLACRFGVMGYLEFATFRDSLRHLNQEDRDYLLACYAATIDIYRGDSAREVDLLRGDLGRLRDLLGRKT